MTSMKHNTYTIIEITHQPECRVYYAQTADEAKTTQAKLQAEGGDWVVCRRVKRKR